MEAERYGEKATRAVTMLLLQLQSDMIKERKSNIKHAVYIDNAIHYISYIRKLLKYGEYYNFSTTLILKARCELKENAIEEALDTDGYIYAVNKNAFTHTKGCMLNEFISTEPCDIVDTFYIDNVLNSMNNIYYNDFYKFIRYGSKEEKEYWETVNGGKEGYLQRRKERIERLRG